MKTGNRISELASGTGPLTLLGARSGFRPFSEVITSYPDTVPITVIDGTNWGIWLATMTNASTLVLTTLIDSSNGGGAITLSSNDKIVFSALPAEFTIGTDDDGSILNPSPFRLSQTIEDFDALKDLEDMVAGEVVGVRYGATNADGLGGMFYWDPADATADDERDTFRPNGAGSGLWKRLLWDIQVKKFLNELSIDTTTTASVQKFATDPLGANPNNWFGIRAQGASGKSMRQTARVNQASEVTVREVISVADASAENRVVESWPLVLPAVAALPTAADALAVQGGELRHGKSTLSRVIPRVTGYVDVASTIAALKAIDARTLYTDGMRAVTLGQAAANDGIRKQWIWNSASTATGDDNIVINPTPNPGSGRWLIDLAVNSVTCTDSDATPTVAGEEFIITANTPPAGGVTDFDNEVERQRITVVRGTADCIIKHDPTKIVTMNGEDLTLTTKRKTASFISHNGVWYEVGGSAGSMTFLTPEMYGAVGNYDTAGNTGTNDSDAFNDLMDAVRAATAVDEFDNISFPTCAVSLRPGAIYRLDETIDMTGIRTRGLHVYGNGATLHSALINDKPVIDAVWSRGIVFHDLRIASQNGSTSGHLVQPRYGIVIGRKDTDDSSEITMRNCYISGWFNKACLLNLSGELCYFEKCAFEQIVDGGADASINCVTLDPNNESGFASEFQTIVTLPTYGMNENLFIQSNINMVQGGRAIRILGLTRSVKFLNSYVACGDGAAVRVDGDHYNMVLDIHVETASSVHNLELDRASPGTSITGLELIDHESQADYIFGSVNSGGIADIRHARVMTPSMFQAGAKLAMPSSGINLHGDVYMDSVTSHNDMTGLNSFRGVVHSQVSLNSNVATPGSGFAIIFSNEDTGPLYRVPDVRALEAGAGSIRFANRAGNPGTPLEGDTYYHAVTKKLHYHDGTAFRQHSALNIVTKSSGPVTVAAEDDILLVDATAGAITINLIAVATAPKKPLTIKKIDSSGNAVTVDGNSSETIDGAATVSITRQNDAITIEPNGTAYFTLSKHTAIGIGTSGAAIPRLDTSNTWSAQQIISSATEFFNPLVLECIHDGATGGPYVTLRKTSITPAANDGLGLFNFEGKDSAANTQIYAMFGASIIVATDTAETGRLNFTTTVAGALADRMYLQHGLLMVGATGGDKGAGTINAIAVYDDNVLLTDYVFDKHLGRAGFEYSERVQTLFDGFDATMFDPLAYSAFWKAHGKLYGMHDLSEVVDGVVKVPLGAMVQRLWQTVELQAIHVDHLREAIAALKKAA